MSWVPSFTSLFFSNVAVSLLHVGRLSGPGCGPKGFARGRACLQSAGISSACRGHRGSGSERAGGGDGSESSEHPQGVGVLGNTRPHDGCGFARARLTSRAPEPTTGVFPARTHPLKPSAAFASLKAPGQLV